MSIVSPAQIEGSLTIPGSKSVTQRAIALATFSEGYSRIEEPGWCNDTVATLAVAQTLGAEISSTAHSISISPGCVASKSVLNFGESGTAIRIFAPLLALSKQRYVLEGEGSLRTRTMTPLIAAIETFGGRCDSTDGYPPLTVSGPMRGGVGMIDCGITSQPLSGLLLALPLAAHNSEITVLNPTSTSYVKLTLDLVEQFGVSIEVSDNLTQFFIFGNQRYRGSTIRVEGDWSGAAFMLVAGAVAGSVRLRNLLPQSTQGDRKIMDFIRSAGAHLEIEGGEVIAATRPLKEFHVECTDCPDLVPPLVALASCASGTSTITGIERLKHKESDRVKALLELCHTLGIEGSCTADTVAISGGQILGGTVNAHNDHRIAMAAAVMALRATGPVTITGAECVAKSYPSFFADLKSISRAL